MSEKKFMQSETQRKKIHAKDGPAISPEWFSLRRKLLLRCFRFLSSLYTDTREKCFFFLAVSPLVALDSGRHRRFPHAWINLWYPGYQNNNISWWEGEPLSLNKRREDKFRDWSMTLKKSKYIEICDFIAYKHSWGLRSDILEEDRLTSVVFEVVH